MFYEITTEKTLFKFFISAHVRTYSTKTNKGGKWKKIFWIIA